MVFWDSPYLVIRKEGWEAKADFLSQSKICGEEFNIPLCYTWQFNKTFVPTRGASAVAASQRASGYTYATITDSDNVFCLMQDDENMQMDQLTVYTIKTRDGIRLKSMNLRWEIGILDFTMLDYDIPGLREDDYST